MLENDGLNSQLLKTVQSLMASPKGLLAMDESNPTCNKRFAEYGIPQTAEARRQYRELLVTVPQLQNYISGAILFDETIRQKTNDGRTFIEVLMHAGIIPGIKVDAGTRDMPGFPGEKITDGLDGLHERLTGYSGMGLRFAKWRAVIAIGSGIPTTACILANMQSLARYAALCQAAGIVPIMEPEVLMEGNHTIEECAVVTELVLNSLFDALIKQAVILECTILKPNMVLPGINAAHQDSIAEVATHTVECLLKNVPANVGGIAFLSGGQDGILASERLNEMNKCYRGRMPWPLTFSFSRALQLPALDIWHGKEENKIDAGQALLKRAMCNSAARSGEYVPAMEKRSLLPDNPINKASST